MNTASQQRLQELGSRFIQLESKLSNTPEKEAISIQTAMLRLNIQIAGRTCPEHGE